MSACNIGAYVVALIWLHGTKVLSGRRVPRGAMVEVRLEFCDCVRTDDVLKASGELLRPVDERAKQRSSIRLRPADHPPCRYNVYIGKKLVLSSQKLGRRPTIEEMKAELQKQTKRNRRGVARR